MKQTIPDGEVYCIAYEDATKSGGLHLALDTISFLPEQAVDRWYRNNCQGAFCLIVKLRLIPLEGRPLPFSYYEKEKYTEPTCGVAT